MTNHETNTSPTGVAARETIFARIAAAVGPVRSNADAAADWEKISRDYIRADSLTGPAVLELFQDRLTDYGAQIFYSSPDQLGLVVEKILTQRGVKRMVIPAGIEADWLPHAIDFVHDEDLSYKSLDQFDGVLTTASAAIAATGTIVLQHGPGQGRRVLTLIPDYHLCIVRTEQVVETVPSAFAHLDSTRPTTFISGPSATADIEMIRIQGVHGPRFMDVVLLG